MVRYCCIFVCVLWCVELLIVVELLVVCGVSIAQVIMMLSQVVLMDEGV